MHTRGNEKIVSLPMLNHIKAEQGIIHHNEGALRTDLTKN